MVASLFDVNFDLAEPEYPTAGGRGVFPLVCRRQRVQDGNDVLWDLCGRTYVPARTTLIASDGAYVRP